MSGLHGRSLLFDKSIHFLANSTFVRAAPITLMLVWLWFRVDSRTIGTRESAIATAFCTVVALVFVKVLRSFLPFRLRPLHNPDLLFVFPGGDSHALFEWSSFPSDTATFFFALSTGLFLTSRLLGSIAIIYSFCAACLTRIYLGYHYPSDILAGMIIGIMAAIIAFQSDIKGSLAYLPMKLLRHHPQTFYVCFFLVFLELTNVFEDLRSILAGLHYLTLLAN